MRPTITGSTVLVTGGAGFIGSHLVDRLYSEGARQVVVIDNLFLGEEQNLADAVQKGAQLYRDDAESMASLEVIMTDHAVDIVFNCATKALAHSFTNPANAFMVNPRITINLLELQRRGTFSTLVHFSTSEVYGSAIYEPMDENHPLNPTTPYAAGKGAADFAVQSYAKTFGLDCLIVRPFNNYGPRQNWKGPLAAVIPHNVQRLLAGGRPVIHGTGLQRRDFIFVMDTVDAVIKLYDRLESGESVNVCTDGQMTIQEVIEGICTCMGKAPGTEFKEGRQSDLESHRGSPLKLLALIDHQKTAFEDGLQITVEWYVDRIK